MAARVVCGSQPEAAVRSSSVAPSGRETASSRTPSLPPGRARCVSGWARCSGTASGVPAPACALSTPMASRPAAVMIRRRRSAASRVGAADPLRHLGACRRRRLGDQAAAEQRLQGSLERGAFEPERLGSRQDAQVGACGSGGEQDRLGVGELRHHSFPSVRGRRGMRGPALAEGPSSGAVGQPAATDGASPASTVTLLSERKSSHLWAGRRRQTPGRLRLSRARRQVREIAQVEAIGVPSHRADQAPKHASLTAVSYFPRRLRALSTGLARGFARRNSGPCPPGQSLTERPRSASSDCGCGVRPAAPPQAR